MLNGCSFIPQLLQLEMEFAAQERAVLVPILHQGSVPLVRGRDKHTVPECLLNCNFEGWVEGGGSVHS